MSYAEEFDSELDSDPDDAKKKNKANIAVALMDSTAEMDDEVEKVLGHRSGLFAVACTHTYPQPLPPTPPAPILNPPTPPPPFYPPTHFHMRSCCHCYAHTVVHQTSIIYTRTV